MADGGESLDSSTDGNDFFYDFPCSPCEKDGRNVGVVKYCVDCDENLCSTCLTQHNKFAMMRGHKVLDQVQTCHGQAKQLPSQRCSKHGGKVIDVFCPTHDDVGCSTCIATNHRLCEDIKFIPDVSSGIKSSKELKQFEADMKAMKTRFETLKTQKRANVQRLNQDKDALQNEIRLVRKKLNDQLDKMEKELLIEAEVKFNQKTEEINISIAKIDVALTHLEHTMKQLNSDNQESEVFVTCKIGKRENYAALEELEAKHTRPVHSFELDTDEIALLIMEGKRMFAVIINKYNIPKFEHKEDTYIRLNDDNVRCGIFSICSLPDGCLVMADLKNKKLKKLDPLSYNVSSLINLPSNPHSLCLVDNTSMAVSLLNLKKIQFVSLNDPVTLGGSFSVGDTCRGLSHCDGLLYVCLGGSLKGREGRGHVEIFNCNGELLRCIYEDLKFPVRISVTNDGQDTMMYISDRFTGVQVRSMDGVVNHRFPTTLDTALPFCLIGKKHICIGEGSTGNVYIHTWNDKRVIVDMNDVEDELSGLYFDERLSQLIVIFVSDVIKILNLKM